MSYSRAPALAFYILSVFSQSIAPRAVKRPICKKGGFFSTGLLSGPYVKIGLSIKNQFSLMGLWDPLIIHFHMWVSLARLHVKLERMCLQ